MTYKVPIYYVVKVQDVLTASGKIVEDVEYLAGPFGKYSNKLIDSLHKFQDDNYHNNISIEIATQYIEVEL